MNTVIYWSIKQLMRFACFCYYKKVAMYNFHELPKKPLLFLPNHHNALMDALLIATYSNGAPYFLTRSDVFTNGLLRALFQLLRMLPVYRIRDGRNSLERNEEVFDTCAELLSKNETILIFPEANHNLKRTVRPLSKGFTRILFRAKEKYPDLDIGLVPVGINYKDAAGFPDSVAFYFGRDFSFKEGYNSLEIRKASMELRERVSDELKLLTTHIEDEENYDRIIGRLDSMHVDYLDPIRVNSLIDDLPFENSGKKPARGEVWFIKTWDTIFSVVNFPILMIWRGIIKKRVPEIEFVSTYRFLFSIISYPLYYLVLGLLLALLDHLFLSGAIVLGLFVFNLGYVKFR